MREVARTHPSGAEEEKTRVSLESGTQVSKGPQHRLGTLVLGCGHLSMFAWKNNLEVSSWALFLFSPSSRRFVVSGKKRKEKLLGLNVKPQDLKKKSVYFSAKFVFLPMGAKTLSNAGLCWQLGAVEKIALYGRSSLIGKEQAQVEWGSDSPLPASGLCVAAGGRD